VAWGFCIPSMNALHVLAKRMLYGKGNTPKTELKGGMRG